MRQDIIANTLGMPKPAVMPCRSNEATTAWAPVIWLIWGGV